MAYNPIFKVEETNGFWKSEVLWGRAAGRFFYVSKDAPEAYSSAVSLAVGAILTEVEALLSNSTQQPPAAL